MWRSPAATAQSHVTVSSVVCVSSFVAHATDDCFYMSFTKKTSYAKKMEFPILLPALHSVAVAVPPWRVLSCAVGGDPGKPPRSEIKSCCYDFITPVLSAWLQKTKAGEAEGG